MAIMWSIGVFSAAAKLPKQVRKLKKRGFAAGYLSDPENNLSYLYIEKYLSWKNALADCSTAFDGRFKDDFWVLKVANSIEESTTVAIEDVDYNTLIDSKKTESDLEATAKESPPKRKKNVAKSKLIERADAYF